MQVHETVRDCDVIPIKGRRLKLHVNVHSKLSELLCKASKHLHVC